MKNNYLTQNKNNWLTFFLLSTFPISLILGNLAINIFFLLLSISFFINLKKNYFFLNNKINLFLLFFFLSLLVNLFFSSDWLNSLPRIIKIIFIFLGLVEIQRFLNNKTNNQKELFFKFWSIIFIVICIDIIYELFLGNNIIGYSSYMPGRIASFFGEELVVGAYFHGFVLFFISNLIISYPKTKVVIGFIIFTLIVISFLIGERSNFIKIFISLSVFYFLTSGVSLKKKITPILFTFFIFIGILNYNDDYKIRYYEQLKKIFQKDGINYFLTNTQYGSHQVTAFEIFKNYPLFGVGVKNFRSESPKKIYENLNPNNNLRYATHPHQLHLELLSETGIIGYISFMIFAIGSLTIAIKIFMINKNLYLLSSIIFISSSLLPIIPSGSFLSTFSSGIFWINFGIMSAFILKKTKF